MSLGVEPVSADAMSRPPRPRHERILNRQRLLRIGLASTVMAAGTLAVLMWAPGPAPTPGRASVAGTMAFVTFVFFQAFNLLNVRSDIRSALRRETLENRSAFAATAVVVTLLVLLVEMDVLHGLFTTTDLTSGQWLACAAVGVTILIAGELVLGRTAPPGPAGTPSHCGGSRMSSGLLFPAEPWLVREPTWNPDLLAQTGRYSHSPTAISGCAASSTRANRISSPAATSTAPTSGAHCPLPRAATATPNRARPS
jgi:hypothetical protein